MCPGNVWPLSPGRNLSLCPEERVWLILHSSVRANGIEELSKEGTWIR